jgi:hypothetical protein
MLPQRREVLAEKRRPTRCDALSADERMCAQTLWAVPMF